jgi:DNA (cytosine-5)-methyltransferase 1
MKRIRRLTPKECERLMSWEDDRTRFGIYDGVVKELSDTQRYKMCGNGIVSQVSKMVVESFLPHGDFRVMSTFSGVDGSCSGLDKRFSLVGFSEFDKHASAVLSYLYPSVHNFGDITKINSSDLPEFDVMFTSPPCQSFSVSGKRKGFEDTRGTLFYDVVRLLKDHPECKYLFFENVPGMLSHNKGDTFVTILNSFSELGFELDFELINAKDCGVPQNRNRLFMVGKRD